MINMQAYRFESLSKNAQKKAVALYCSDPDLLKWQEEHGNRYGIVTPAFNAMGWIFTEHGERIA